MAMSRAGLAVGAIATIALAGCGGGNGNTGNEVHGGARVVVAEHHRERADGALYVEGAVQFRGMGFPEQEIVVSGTVRSVSSGRAVVAVEAAQGDNRIIRNAEAEILLED